MGSRGTEATRFFRAWETGKKHTENSRDLQKGPLSTEKGRYQHRCVGKLPEAGERVSESQQW